MLLCDYLEESARRLPEKTALVVGNERLSYATLDARANHLAAALVRRGVERGDRVAILGESTAETVIALWAALKANAVFMVVSREAKQDKIAYLLQDSGAKALVGSARLLGELEGGIARAPELAIAVSYGGVPSTWSAGAKVVRFEDALAEGGARPARKSISVDLASIIYTSGSTGEPKGVMLTHANMVAASTSITTYLEAREDDVVLVALPLAFNYGLYQLILAARVGATIVLANGFSFPSLVLELMSREKVTAFPAVPTIFAMLCAMRDVDHDLSSVRYLTNTAASLPVPHIRRLREIFPNARIFSMYGLTECKRCTYLPPADLDRKPTSVGIAIPNSEVWIEDEHGNRLGPNQVGQLVVRGANVMRGYWRKPEATAERLRPGPLPGEMVLLTGDLCRMDEEGYVYFVSRMDDVIKSRGEKVPPREVEDCLYALPGVREAAVIGVPDPLLGQAIKAFVVADPARGIAAGDVIAHCKARLESYMVPKHVEFRDALPKTDTGKIKKTGLA